MTEIQHTLAVIQVALRELVVAADEADQGDVVVDTGLIYRVNDPVQIWVRRRGRRFDLTDGGTAVMLAGKPVGWLETAAALLAEDGFNINRRGIVFVPAVIGRDIAKLALRLAAASRRVYLALLEAETFGS